MNTDWIKASASGSDGGDCVEMRRHDGAVEVRDTKNRQGGTLQVTPGAWADVLQLARSGALDHLA